MSVEGIASIGTLLSNLLLDKTTNVKASVSPEVTNAFNQILQSLGPQMTGTTIGEDEIMQIIDNTLQNSNRNFLQTRFNQSKMGGYNSTTLRKLEDSARAEAINKSAEALISAKAKNADINLNAGNVLAGLTSNMGANTRSTSQVQEAPLGGLAAPLAAYAGYKFLTGGKTGLGSLFERSGAAAPITEIGGTAAKAASAASTAAGGAAKTALPGFNDLVDSTLSGLTGTASDVYDLLSVNPTDFASSISASKILPGEVAGIPVRDATGAGSIFDALGDVGSNINSILNPTFDFGFGPTSVPIMAGFNNFSQGNIGQGVGDIGATMALNAIPGIGPILALAGGLTKNGPLDDWFGVDSCFITTAMMKALQADFRDNGPELTALREFRDGYMMETPDRAAMIREYYRVAPHIVDTLRENPEQDQIYSKLYMNYLVPAISAISSGMPDAARQIYRDMYIFAYESAFNTAYTE